MLAENIDQPGFEFLRLDDLRVDLVLLGRFHEQFRKADVDVHATDERFIQCGRHRGHDLEGS